MQPDGSLTIRAGAFGVNDYIDRFKKQGRVSVDVAYGEWMK